MDKNYDLAGNIIGCAMRVHRELGPGFNESVYQSALVIELAEAGFGFETERKLNVYYREKLVGDFYADIVILGDEPIILELKAVQNIIPAHEAQLVNYLTATMIETGLLLNFGSSSLQFKKKFRSPRQR